MTDTHSPHCEPIDSNSFHLLPYIAIAWQLATTGKGRKLTELSFWVWGDSVCHSVSSCFLVWFTSRLGRAASRSPLELRRWPGYVLVLNLLQFGDFWVWISVLSVYWTACLASVLGHIDDAMWEMGNGGGDCLLPVMFPTRVNGVGISSPNTRWQNNSVCPRFQISFTGAFLKAHCYNSFFKPTWF